MIGFLTFYTAKNDALTNRKDLIELEVESSTVLDLQQLACVLDNANFPVILGKRSDGATNEGMVDHYLTTVKFT